MYCCQSAFSGSKLNSNKFVWGRGDVQTCEICFFVALGALHHSNISMSWYAADKSLKRTKGIWWSTVLGTLWIICKHVLLQILVGWCTMHTLEARSMARLRKGQKIASSSGVGVGVAWGGGKSSRLTWHISNTETFRHPELHPWPFDSTVVFIHAKDGQWIFLQKDLTQSDGTGPSKSSVSRIQRGTNRLISLRNMCS